LLDIVVGLLSGDHIGNIDGFFGIIASLSLSLLLASFFTLFVRDEVFYAWRRYAYWWVVPILWAYTISSHKGGGFAGGNPFVFFFPYMLGYFTLTTPIYLALKSRNTSKKGLRIFAVCILIPIIIFFSL
jgi:hypothetical protein